MTGLSAILTLDLMTLRLDFFTVKGDDKGIHLPELPVAVLRGRMRGQSVLALLALHTALQPAAPVAIPCRLADQQIPLVSSCDSLEIPCVRRGLVQGCLAAPWRGGPG